MAVTVTRKIEVELSPGVWTEIQGDHLKDMPVQITYGIRGNGPLDRVASTGQLNFGLRNDARNTGATLGWYSPAHASKRVGWTFGKRVRVRFTSGAIVDKVKFLGTIRNILPEAGRHRLQRVSVTAYDPMRDLAEAALRQVSVQVNQTETELLAALLAALPVDNQPPATALDTGLDSYPYAFDDLSGGQKALAVIKDVVVSSWGLCFSTGDGTLVYQSRHAAAVKVSQFAFTDERIGVPSSLDRVWDPVTCTTHPKLLSPTATDALYVLPTDTVIEIPAGTTREVWTDYSDPNDRQAPVGGTDVVEILVAGTHYSANSASDGSGTNLTASIAANIDPFSSTAKWTLTNSATQTAYIRVLTVIGRAVRDPGPQTYTSGTGHRELAIDLPYQDDAELAQGIADFVRLQFSSLTQQIEEIEFPANLSADFMRQALEREPGDRITVSEAVTGLTDVECVIQSVELRTGSGGRLSCRWGLAPASPFTIWQLGVAGAGELGETTVLGF